MKTCKNCSREFDEQEDDNKNPMVELGNIFLKQTKEDDPTDYCSACIEKLGMLNLSWIEEK
jgi:hypothetical protein